MEEPTVQPRAPLRVIGRYALYEPIASGGMATVHLGRLLGPVGFSRTVAIKRSHPEMAADPEFVSMFLDEARLAARIRHPNVVSTLDVVALEGELFLVMDFVQGESLSRLMSATKISGATIPSAIACTIMAGALHGLHAAHEAKNERGEPLHLVHRDVSPQNILVGVDGIARVLDFGVAKAVGRVQTTRDGQIKGKLSYLAPEQMSGDISRQSDIYSATVVLWELLTGERLFQADNPGDLINQVLHKEVPRPGSIAQDIPAELDRIVLKGLARKAAHRFATAREMAIELEHNGGLVSAVEVGEWVEATAREAIAGRAQKIAEIEHYSPSDYPDQRASLAEGTYSQEAIAVENARRRGELPTRENNATIRDGGPFADHLLLGDRQSYPTASAIASISEHVVSEPRGNRSRIAMVAAALLLLLLAGLTLLRSSQVQVDPTGTALMSASTESPVPPSVRPIEATPIGPSTERTNSPEALVIDAVVGTSTASPAKAKPSTRTRAPRKPAVDCSVPYIFDPKGIKHLRPECLQ